MNDKVNFTLTSVKGHMGSDSYAFTANLNVNGKIVANVMNDGNGGSNIYYWNTAEDRNTYVPFLEDFTRENAMGWMLESLDGEYAELEDWAIHILLDNRDYTRHSKTKVVFRESAASEDIFMMPTRAGVTRAAIIEHLQGIHADLRVFDSKSQKWVA